MEAYQIKALIEQAVVGKTTVDEVVRRIVQEMGRGPRVLVVDENLLDLERQLAELNYTTRTVEPGSQDVVIKKRLRGRVFVTQNGADFCNLDDLQKYDYGLIWITTGRDAKVMAKKVESAMMTHGFKANLNQCVKV